MTQAHVNRAADWKQFDYRNDNKQLLNFNRANVRFIKIIHSTGKKTQTLRGHVICMRSESELVAGQVLKPVPELRTKPLAATLYHPGPSTSSRPPTGPSQITAPFLTNTSVLFPDMMPGSLINPQMNNNMTSQVPAHGSECLLFLSTHNHPFWG